MTSSIRRFPKVFFLGSGGFFKKLEKKEKELRGF
jgi:hypothetical protein